MADPQPIPPLPNWTGAWPQEVLFPFLLLTGDQSIKDTEAQPARTLGDLADPEKARRVRVADLLARFRKHDGYKRLKGMAGFNKVMAERLHLARGNALFADPFGEIRMAHAMAMIVGGFDPEFRPKRATLAQQRNVLKLARELHDSLMPGAQPSDVFEMSDLRRLLGNLDVELGSLVTDAERSGRRPARADSDAAQRYWVIGFCKSLIREFGEAPPNVVKDVAGWIGYTPDESTISRYITRAFADLGQTAPMQLSQKKRR